MNKKNIILFCFVIFIAVSVRLFNLGNVPFVSDEFLDVNATYGYHKSGEWQAWDFNHNKPSLRQNKASDRRAWVYREQVSALYNYLPPTEANIRLLSVLWGVLTVVILYIVTYIFTKSYLIAFFASFLFAFSIPAIEINRKIRMYSMFAPVFLSFSAVLYYFLENSKTKSKKLIVQIFNFDYRFLLPVFLLGALSYHLHPLSANIVIIVFIFFVIKMLMEFKNKNYINKYLVYNVIFSLTAIIMVLFFSDKVSGTIKFFGNHWNYINHILINYWHPLIGMFLIFVGLYTTFKVEKFKNEYIWINVNFFVILFASILLWKRNVGAQYIFFAQTFGFILVSIGIYTIINFIQKKMYSNKMIITYGILAVIIFLPNYAYFFKKDNTYHITSKGNQANYRNLFLYVKKNKIDNDVMITRNFRNYYFSGFDMQIFDFGSERDDEILQKEGKVKKVTKNYVEKIVKENPHGWVVYSDNDKKFITKEAREYFSENMKEINDSLLVRGKVKIYRWSE